MPPKPPPVHRIQTWLTGRTLRGRLIAGLVALLFLACASVGAVTYAHLRTVLVGQLDQQLMEASARFTGCVNPGPPPNRDGPGPGNNPDSHRPPPGNSATCAEKNQSPGTLNATLTSAGVVVNSYLAAANGTCHLTAADKRELAALRAGRPAAVTLSSYGAYQVLATKTADGIVVTGLPLSPADETLRQVATAEIAIFSIALLLTGVIGASWVRLLLRPLRRVATTATRVAELPLGTGDVTLSERVTDANPRTEVGQVGAAFNRMLGHVESALARRAASEARLRRFAADASHELRTPLAAIRGYAELARRDPGPVSDSIAGALSRVESESARMSVLVDELLLLARLDAGRPLAMQPVDLTRLVIDVTSDARVAATGHRWVLDLPGEPVEVRGDDHRLHQVLANLLSNAAKHTPKGTTVTVALAATGDGVQVTVTDNGPGIPEDLQPMLFERFVRGDTSRSRAGGSTGLGLAIVDAVIAAHHGRVEVSSRPGQTRFTITLPRPAKAAG